MEAEKQLKEPISRISYSRSGGGNMSFMDNRPQAIVQAKLIDVIQKTSKRENQLRQLPSKLNNIMQCDAFWSIDNNNRVQDSEPVQDQPHGHYIKREGGNLSHRLYDRSRDAEGAAKAASGWHGGPYSVRKPGTPKDGAGYYLYNHDFRNGNDVPLGTPLVARHDTDPNAKLNLNNVDEKGSCKHWHAATAGENANIRNFESRKEQPNYILAGEIEHYFINPFL